MASLVAFVFRVAFARVEREGKYFEIAWVYFGAFEGFWICWDRKLIFLD
jgi:hypothetical protein